MTPIPIPTPVIPIIPIIPVLPIRGGRVEPLPGITTLRDPAAPVELARYLDAHGAARLMIEFHDELARLDELLPLLERAAWCAFGRLADGHGDAARRGVAGEAGGAQLGELEQLLLAVVGILVLADAGDDLGGPLG